MKVLMFGLSLLLVAGCASTGSYKGRTGARIDEAREYKKVHQAEGSKAEKLGLIVNYEPNTIDAGLTLEVVNNTVRLAKVIWDESVFIKSDGSVEKVFHNGVKISARASSLEPTVIPPGASMNDEIIPVSNVYWREGVSNGGHYTPGGWTYTPICGEVSRWTRKVSDDQCVGKVFGFYLVVEVGGVRHQLEHKFTFVAKHPLVRGKHRGIASKKQN